MDWENLQRPGFSPDYIESRYETHGPGLRTRPTGSPRSPAQTLLRNNRPLLAYIAGKPAAFTSKDHNFLPGETVEKQLIVINNSRETVTCDCEWSFDLPDRARGTREITVPTGQQERMPLRFELPAQLAPGRYELQRDRAFQHRRDAAGSLSPSTSCRARCASCGTCAQSRCSIPGAKHAGSWTPCRSHCRELSADADLAAYDILVVGKKALTVQGAAPDIARVRDGLKVMVFEQTPEVLEKRFGFRVATYGLRQVLPRIPDHPVLAGLGEQHLRDWRGEATILPPRLEYLADFPIQRRSDGPVVRHPGLAPLALRQSRQRRLGADREAGARRLPADPRRRLQPPVQPADGVPRGPGHGAVLPDGRDGTHGARPRRRDARPQPARSTLRRGSRRQHVRSFTWAIPLGRAIWNRPVSR